MQNDFKEFNAGVTAEQKKKDQVIKAKAPDVWFEFQKAAQRIAPDPAFPRGGHQFQSDYRNPYLVEVWKASETSSSPRVKCYYEALCDMFQIKVVGDGGYKPPKACYTFIADDHDDVLLSWNSAVFDAERTAEYIDAEEAAQDILSAFLKEYSK